MVEWPRPKAGDPLPDDPHDYDGAARHSESLRLREDKLRRAVTHLWQAVRDLNGTWQTDLDAARELLIELEDEPWPDR